MTLEVRTHVFIDLKLDLEIYKIDLETRSEP